MGTGDTGIGNEDPGTTSPKGGNARELGQTAKETGTAIEINACANLVNPAYSDRYVEEYIAYLSILAGEGVCFALGSDAHDIGRLEAILTAREVASRLGLEADRIWRPQGTPMAGARRL